MPSQIKINPARVKATVVGKRKTNIDISSLEKRGYFFGKKIGKGSYGNVVLAKYHDQCTGVTTNLACKYIDKSKAPKDFTEKFFPRELYYLTIISHQNIIRVHSILQSGSSVFIFMRCAENGDLLDYIKSNGHINEGQANLWFYQMVSAVKYLHSMDIAHRDLKCENIFISKHLNIKIGDFGFARSAVDDSGTKIFSETFCGSAAYAAPEVVDGKPYDPLKADIWSLAVILSIMVNGIMPFDDSNTAKLIRDQKERRYRFNHELMDKLSSECKTVIHTCLEPNPIDRCDIESLYQTLWLRKRVEKNQN